MKQKFFAIGLVCIVFGAGCLLVVFVHEKKMSDIGHSVNVSTTEASVTQSASSSVPINASSTAVMTPVATTTPSQATEQSQPTQPKMNFEIVTTPAEQQQGLGGRSVIPDNFAMLFVFPTDVDQGFWMKDMLTSIDMIWLSDNGTILAIDGSVAPDTYPNVFYPPVPVKYVLETRAGFAVEKNWHIGTQVALPLPY